MDFEISIDRFHRLPRHPDWKYEYWDGRAHLSSRPQPLYLARSTTASREPGADVVVAPFAGREHDAVADLVSRVWRRLDPYASCPSEAAADGSQEITVVVDAVAVDETDFQADAGAAEIDIEQTATNRRNLVNLHRFPGGEQYSRNEIDAMIAEQLGEEPADVAPAWTGEELTDAEFTDAVMGPTEAAYLDEPEFGTTIHLVGAADLDPDPGTATELDIANFPPRDEATGGDYAAVIEAYGPEAVVAYDDAGAPLYIETGTGEVIELNDSGYSRAPVSAVE